MKMMKDLENKSCEEWLRQLRFSVEKSRLRGNLIVLHKSLKGAR